MAGPNFVSPGAMGGNAIQEFLMQREQMERQRMLDALLQQRQAQEQQMREAQLGLQREQMSGVQEDRRTAQSNLETERGFRRAATIAQNAIPSDPVDPETAALLQEHGFGGQVRRVPGVVQQGPQIDTQDEVPIYDVTQTPETLQMRGGSQYLAARTAAEERAAMAEAAQAAQAERAAADRDAANARAADTNELRRDMARMQAGAAGASRGLQDEMTRLRIDGERARQEMAQQDRARTQSNVAADRARIRDLAQGLMSNPALASITGPIEGRRDTFLGGENVKAHTLFKQLEAALAFEGRTKMKGQGTITDYEAKAVERVMSALNRAAGETITKEQLLDIVNAFQGDMPNAGPGAAAPPAVGGRRRYDMNGNPIP